MGGHGHNLNRKIIELIPIMLNVWNIYQYLGHCWGRQIPYMEHMGCVITHIFERMVEQTYNNIVTH